jgi:hypothetical protein
MAGGKLVTLAQAAGQAVVTATATDAWETVKAGIARMVARPLAGRTTAAEPGN